MDAPSITDEVIGKLERLCNQYIREDRKMYPVYYDSPDDPALAGVRNKSVT